MQCKMGKFGNFNSYGFEWCTVIGFGINGFPMCEIIFVIFYFKKGYHFKKIVAKVSNPIVN